MRITNVLVGINCKVLAKQSLYNNRSGLYRKIDYCCNDIHECLSNSLNILSMHIFAILHQICIL